MKGLSKPAVDSQWSVANTGVHVLEPTDYGLLTINPSTK